MFGLLHGAPRQYVSVLVGLLAFLTLAPLPSLADDGLAIGAAATVTSGEALRSGPGYEATIITDVAPGTPAIIADAPFAAADGSLWYQVDVGGQFGYLPTYALSAAEVADPAVEEPVVTDPALVEEPIVEEPVAETTAPVATGVAYIAWTDGDGALCRADAGYESATLATLPEGSTVEVTGDPVGEWQPVFCGGTVGYVNVSFISWEPVASEPVVEEVVEPGADELTTEAAPLSEESRNRRGDGGGGSGSGQAIADFAMQHVGYPYVYAGAGPDAFDCSGFTMYVIQQTLGIDITHDMAVQIGMGASVSRDALQPGDLVFFQNTFQPGLSHAGVYVGGGQFVHAENESTGVRVSDLNSDYYSSRWYGATRLA